MKPTEKKLEQFSIHKLLVLTNKNAIHSISFNATNWPRFLDEFEVNSIIILANPVN